MLVVMNAAATEAQIESILSELRTYKVIAERLPGQNRTAIGVTGNKEFVRSDVIARMEGVLEVIHVTKKWKRVSREFYPQKTVISVGEAQFGGAGPVIIAGPCSVESREQIIETALAVKKHGAKVLRGGAFKPRTSPYFFQGIGYAGIKLMQEAREASGLPICVEIVSTEDVELFAAEVDMIQVGARNMQNYDLLKKLGKIKTPVLLKRGFACTVEEFLLAAEYILDGGNPNVVLCERGVRTFEPTSRNTLDLNTVALLPHLTHLPIVVDPSHAAGRHDLVTPLARAAIATGCDGLIVEVHPNPKTALSDANQQLDFAQFAKMMRNVLDVSAVIRELESVTI